MPFQPPVPPCYISYCSCMWNDSTAENKSKKANTQHIYVNITSLNEKRVLWAQLWIFRSFPRGGGVPFSMAGARPQLRLQKDQYSRFLNVSMSSPQSMLFKVVSKIGGTEFVTTWSNNGVWYGKKCSLSQWSKVYRRVMPLPINF